MGAEISADRLIPGMMGDTSLSDSVGLISFMEL